MLKKILLVSSLLSSLLIADSFVELEYTMGSNSVDLKNISSDSSLTTSLGAGIYNNFEQFGPIYIGLRMNSLFYKGYDDYDMGKEINITPALKYCTGPMTFTSYLGYNSGSIDLKKNLILNGKSNKSLDYSGLVMGVRGDILIWKVKNSTNSSSLGLGYERVMSELDDYSEDYNVNRFLINVNYRF
jgi:hypothetical protein